MRMRNDAHVTETLIMVGYCRWTPPVCADCGLMRRLLGYVGRPYMQRHDTELSSIWHPHVWPGRFRRICGIQWRIAVSVCGSSGPDIDSRRNATIATHMAWRSTGRTNHRVLVRQTASSTLWLSSRNTNGVSACRVGRQRTSTSHRPSCRRFRYRQFWIYILSNS